MKKVFELDFRGRKLIVETGELAKQASGAVLVRYGDTVVLSTVVVSKSANVLSDFFKNHPGSSTVIAVDKDGQMLSTNMTMDPTAFPQLLRLFLTWKNMTA